jgi:hypothetical protein
MEKSSMQITFDQSERRYFFKLLMLKAQMEKDRKASRFWVDLAEQFASNRAVSNLRASHLKLLLDIIKYLGDTIKVEISTMTDEKRKVTLDSITTLLNAAQVKIESKLSSLTEGEANGV